jgi:hypothetical protein
MGQIDERDQMSDTSDRLLGAWNLLVTFVIAPVAMLSILLAWPTTLQVGLSILMAVAVFAPPLVPKLRRRRR